MLQVVIQRVSMNQITHQPLANVCACVNRAVKVRNIVSQKNGHRELKET